MQNSDQWLSAISNGMISAADLAKCCSYLLQREGMPAAKANICAKILVDGDLRGHDSHGISRLEMLIEGSRRGTIDLCAQPQIQSEGEAYVLYDACHGAGHIAAYQAVKHAVAIARRIGVGLAGVKNGSHIGSLAYYAEIASSAGCLAIVGSTSSPAVVAAGGTCKTLGTNPLAFAAPMEGDDLVADFATSSISRSKLLSSYEAGANLEPGCAVDRDGKPTLDARRALEGGISVIGGGIKGTLLSLLVAILAGPLIGAAPNHLVRGTRLVDEPPNKGDFFLVVDIAKLTDLDTFKTNIGALIAAVTSNNHMFRAPGSGTKQLRQERLSSGVPLGPEATRTLVKYLEPVHALPA